MDDLQPYRVSQCPWLLVKNSHPSFDDLRVGSLFKIKDVTYEILHYFHDCIAIEEVNND